jgi:hypothetical protein
MHIEPGIVIGAKMALSYGTALAAGALLVKHIVNHLTTAGPTSLLVKSLMTTMFVFIFFEILPHHAVGVSEVHFILGSTLFLIFGIAPAGIGLTLGLFIQSFFLAPTDLAQFSINITTLLMPLFAMHFVANKIIPANTAYKDVSYLQALKLSMVFQGGIISWVGFWALYGQGLGEQNISQVLAFAGAYSSVIILEPIIDIAILAIAKTAYVAKGNVLLENRLYHSA